MTGMQVIRMADAHAWVEAWIPGQGWVTFDPTPSDRARDRLGNWGKTRAIPGHG